MQGMSNEKSTNDSQESALIPSSTEEAPSPYVSTDSEKDFNDEHPASESQESLSPPHLEAMHTPLLYTTTDSEEDPNDESPTVVSKSKNKKLKFQLMIAASQQILFAAIFTLKSKSAFATLLDKPYLHYTLYPLAALTDIAFAAAATYEFSQHKNKNLGAYLNLSMMWTKAILATTAVTGALAAAAAFTVATPAMFVGVVGLAFIHSAGKLLQSLHQWQTHRNDPELSKHYKKQTLNYALSTAVTALVLTGIAVLMLNPVTGPAVALGIGIAAAVACGVGLIKTGYDLYKAFKARKTAAATSSADSVAPSPQPEPQRTSGKAASFGFGFFPYWRRKDYSKDISSLDDIRKIAENKIKSLQKQGGHVKRRSDKIELLSDLISTISTSDETAQSGTMTFDDLINKVLSNQYPGAFDSFFKNTSDVQNILMAAAAYHDREQNNLGPNSSMSKLQRYFGQSADFELGHHYEKASFRPDEAPVLDMA